MPLLGNFIWFVFLGGWFFGLAWTLLGCLFYVTIIGMPFGRACFKIASFTFFPFGKELIDEKLLGKIPESSTTLSNILWFIFAGLWLALGHVAAAIATIVSCVTIIPVFLGAPAWALAHLKLAKVSLAPLGKRIVTVEEASALRQSVFLKKTGGNG